MKRKLFTLDGIMISFVSCMLYASIDVVCGVLGLPLLASVALSFVLGAGLEGALNKFAFSEAVQRKPVTRIILYVACVLSFVVGQYVFTSMMGLSLVDYLLSQLTGLIGFSILGFVVTMLIRAYRVHRIRKRYGDARGGYQFDVSAEDIEEANRENHRIFGVYDPELAVRTRYGVFVGEETGDCVSYLGIPYAKPPVGELRWKAPEPLEPSDVVFEATNLGASGVQVEHEGSILRYHRQSEDFLCLNVAVVREADEVKKPVVVVFHHGDFMFGGSADPVLYGYNFVNTHPDIVFVSFNYRLGIFGFIDFTEVPGGEDYADSLNLGLLDQVAALRWVHENIAAFGGDPDRVTVVGFESGATSICLLAATEDARDLFRRAYVFFGCPLFAYDSPAASRAVAKELLRETKTRTMDELMGLDTETLKEAAQKLWGQLSGPTLDGTWIPADPYGAYRDGIAAGIEFIFGIPTNEHNVARSFVGNKKYEELVSLALDDLQQTIGLSAADSVRKYRDAQRGSLSESEVNAKVIEQWNALCMYRTALNLSRGGSTVRLMQWDEEPLLENLGSGTVDVVATLLGNGEALEMYGSVVNEDLSEILQGLLVKYAKGEALELYHNEVMGFDGLVWEEFPQALIVADDSVSCGSIEDRLTEIDGLLDDVIPQAERNAEASQPAE